jgi:hypothetical protein
MVFKVCVLIYALLLGSWLFEHGFSHAGQIAVGVVVAIAIVVAHYWAFFLGIWLLWPKQRKH